MQTRRHCGREQVRHVRAYVQNSDAREKATWRGRDRNHDDDCALLPSLSRLRAGHDVIVCVNVNDCNVDGRCQSPFVLLFRLVEAMQCQSTLKRL